MLIQTNLTKQKSPIVELLGVAGVGKTTLLNALCQRHPQMRSGVCLPKSHWVSAWIEMTPFWLPTVIHQFSSSRSNRRSNSAARRSMVYLQAWHDRLERHPPDLDGVTVFDHGPMFRLALLREFRPEILRSDRGEKWWNAMFEKWANTLDLIIYLEAPDEILLDRIEKRHRRHAVKGQSQENAYNFFTRYRRAYQPLLDRLVSEGYLEVLRCNTHEESVNRVVDRISAKLGSMDASEYYSEALVVTPPKD